MTKFVIKCVTNGTSVSLQAPGQTAEKALWNIRRNKLARNAGTFLVFNRKTGGMVLAVVGSRVPPPVM